MIKIQYILSAAAGAMILSGCVKDDIYNTYHPDEAGITVTAIWNDIGTGISKPSGYTIEFGSDTETASADRHTFSKLFDPGTYGLYLYNKVSEIAVADGIATVQPAARQHGHINSLPGWFFAGMQEVIVEQDTDHEFTVDMRQQVRQLTLVIEPEGGTADKIESITATLSGVAGVWDISADKPSGASTNVRLTFTKQTSGDHPGKWTATTRLLGVTGPEQNLVGTITFTGGNPDNQPLESDLSGDLAKFNDNKKTPMILGGQLAKTPTEPGFTATITDWKQIPDGTGTAN